MRTIDTNPEHGLALVQDGEKWSGADNNTRYIALAEAPPLSDEQIMQTYLGQLHYVASHTVVGLQVHDRIGPNGEKPPKHGWTRWKNL